MFDHFRLNEDDYKIIPLNFCPTKFHSITFEGWNNFSFDINDEKFSILINLASQTVNYFIELYKEKYAFTQPQFCLKPDGTCTIKIGLIENDLYDSLMKAAESNHAI